MLVVCKIKDKIWFFELGGCDYAIQFWVANNNSFRIRYIFAILCAMLHVFF